MEGGDKKNDLHFQAHLHKTDITQCISSIKSYLNLQPM